MLARAEGDGSVFRHQRCARRACELPSSLGRGGAKHLLGCRPCECAHRTESGGHDGLRLPRRPDAVALWLVAGGRRVPGVPHQLLAEGAPASPGVPAAEARGQASHRREHRSEPGSPQVIMYVYVVKGSHLLFALFTDESRIYCRTQFRKEKCPAPVSLHLPHAHGCLLEKRAGGLAGRCPLRHLECEAASRIRPSTPSSPRRRGRRPPAAAASSGRPRRRACSSRRPSSSTRKWRSAAR